MFQANEHSGPAVSATDRKSSSDASSAAFAAQESTPAERKSLFSSFSVKAIAYTSAAIIIILFLSITVTNLVLSKAYYQGPKDNGLSLRLNDKIRALESQLVFFQQIVNHVAAQPTTQDILENKDEAGAQTWALQMQRFLPQAMGVALLTSSGQIMGSPADTQLGPQSLTDLAKLSQGESISMPPVHRLTGATSHFDLVAPVLDETDTQIGMVFVSFGLKTLYPLIKNNTNHGQKLVLRDGYGNIITQHNLLDSEENDQQQKTKLSKSDWQLSLTENVRNSLPSFLSLAIFNISALLLTVGIIAFLVRYALRTLGTDFTQIKTLLNNLAEGETLSDEFVTPQLRETAEILPAISHIQRGLEKKQQLLQHRELSDELTGLPNRRQFNIEFARAYDFARRGTSVCVVRIHLQGLEKLNDKQTGQAAKLLSKTLKEHTRKVDHVARLDTEQFSLLLFGMSANGTSPCLERMHKSFLGMQAQHPAISDNQICSLQFGYTMIHAHRDNSAAEVLKRAETALSEAQTSEERCIIAA